MPSDPTCKISSWYQKYPNWLIPGSQLCRPDARELDETTIQRSAVVVDSMHALEAGELHLDSDRVVGELGHLFVRGEFLRNESTDLTVFKSVGIALQDVATAHAVYLVAETQNIGISANL